MARKKATSYAFLDTNIFIQFQPFDQIDWLTELNYQQVCLMIAPVVHKELEKFKGDSHNERRRNRSRLVTAKLNDILPPVAFGSLGSQVPVSGEANVTIWEVPRHPPMKDYPDLVPEQFDDQLFAAVLQFRRDHPEIPAEDVILVSDDGGVLRRSGGWGIRAQALNPKYKLLDEPTDTEKELNRVKQELQDLQRQIPQLSLDAAALRGGPPGFWTEIAILREIGADDLQADLDREASEIAWVLPPDTMVYENVVGRSLIEMRAMAEAQTLAQASSNLFVTRQAINQYNDECAAYLADYKAYLLALYNHAATSLRLGPLSLILRNEGTVSAVDVTIQIDLPADFAVGEDESDLLPERPVPPKHPQRPTPPIGTSPALDLIASLRQQGLYAGGNLSFPPYTPALVDAGPPVEVGPIIRQTPTGWRVEWELDKSVPHRPWSLTSVWLGLPPVLGERTYELPATLVAEKLRPQQRKLVLRVLGTEQVVSLAELRAPEDTEES